MGTPPIIGRVNDMPCDCAIVKPGVFAIVAYPLLAVADFISCAIGVTTYE